jgi:signal transduction histidine kinase
MSGSRRLKERIPVVSELRCVDSVPCRWRQAGVDGIRISTGAQRRLFEQCGRADNAQAVATARIGPGSRMVRLVVGPFGALVRRESAEGQGGTFGFAVPAIEAV